jgi:hypothetical protein
MRVGMMVVLLIFLLSGCAGSHYVREEDGQVLLYFKQPEASEVRLACSLDRFQPHSATRNRSGTWEVAMPAAQEFSYFYLVDGSVVVPDCRLSETDDFGSRNCLYVR